MYWSLQQSVEESDSSQSPGASSRGASPEPSIDGINDSLSPASSPATTASWEASPSPSTSTDDDSLLATEVLNMIIDDTTSDDVISTSDGDNAASDTQSQNEH